MGPDYNADCHVTDRVIFADQSRFLTVVGRHGVYRRRGERTATCCIHEVVPFGVGSVEGSVGRREHHWSSVT